MAVVASQVTVEDTATLIYTSSGHSTVMLFNPGAEVFIGGSSGVTVGNGFQLGGGADYPTVKLDLCDGDTVYGIKASGTRVVYVIATS